MRAVITISVPVDVQDRTVAIGICADLSDGTGAGEIRRAVEDAALRRSGREAKAQRPRALWSTHR
jgi:hypothetical protein